MMHENRLRGGVEALSAALGLSTPQVLSMLATDLNLLDTPPLRVRQYLEGLSQVLQVSVELCAQLAWQCPYLLRVEAAAVQVRCVQRVAVESMVMPGRPVLGSRSCSCCSLHAQQAADPREGQGCQA